MQRARGASAGGRAVAACWGRLVGASVAPLALGWTPLLAAIRQPWLALVRPVAGLDVLNSALAAMSDAARDNGSDPAGDAKGSIIRRGLDGSISRPDTAKRRPRNAVSGAASPTVAPTSMAPINTHRLLAATAGGTAGRERVARLNPAATADPADPRAPRTVPPAGRFAPDGTAWPAAGGTPALPYRHGSIPVTGAAGSATGAALATERASGGGLGELVQRWNGDGTTDRAPTDHQQAAQRAGVWHYPAPAPGRGTLRHAEAMQDAGEADDETSAGDPGPQGAVHDQASQGHADHGCSNRDRAGWGTPLTSLAPQPASPPGALTIDDLENALDDLLQREAQRYGLDRWVP